MDCYMVVDINKQVECYLQTSKWRVTWVQTCKWRVTLRTECNPVVDLDKQVDCYLQTNKWIVTSRPASGELPLVQSVTWLLILTSKWIVT